MLEGEILPSLWSLPGLPQGQCGSWAAAKSTRAAGGCRSSWGSRRWVRQCVWSGSKQSAGKHQCSSKSSPRMHQVILFVRLLAASGVLVTSPSPPVPTMKRGDMCATLPAGAVGFPSSSSGAAQLWWLMLLQNFSPTPRKRPAAQPHVQTSGRVSGRRGALCWQQLSCLSGSVNLLALRRKLWRFRPLLHFPRFLGSFHPPSPGS